MRRRKARYVGGLAAAGTATISLSVNCKDAPGYRELSNSFGNDVAKLMAMKKAEIARTSKQPFSWCKGLAYTLGAGTAFASLIPYALILAYVANMELLDLRAIHDPSVSMLPSLRAVGLVFVILLAIPFALFVFAAAPITLSYAIMRWTAGQVYLNLLRRTMIGLVLGVSAETAIPAFLSARGSVWQRITAPHSSILPLLVAVFTGAALGAFIRPHWLGLSETMETNRSPATQR